MNQHPFHRPVPKDSVAPLGAPTSSSARKTRPGNWPFPGIAGVSPGLCIALQILTKNRTKPDVNRNSLLYNNLS